MQRNSLARLYASKTDDELLALAAAPDSLVEEARLVLANEMRGRNLVAGQRREVEKQILEPSSRLARSNVLAGRWNWVWPNVDTREAAERATKQAFWAAVLCAASTGLFVLLAEVGVGFAQAMGFDVSALADVLVFGFIAIGLWRGSRVTAWAGLVLYSAERAYMWSTVGMKNPVIAAVFVLAFIGGVRGTSALYRLNKVDIQQSKDVAG